ncbi:hypothetical protein Ddye_005428 [Dipteronia dyeriana]|uniref:Uncharacterized protein n=1 Tax=Dipteronia dyeriana TaxID=168575 RepID=A0AAD9XGF0_9ROSI|nr:hypothetical protein Ddye_005428 [Dipteronia dyeriana]
MDGAPNSSTLSLMSWWIIPRCGDNENYNVDFHYVSAQVRGQLFSRKFFDPRRHILPKDRMTDMRDKHDISLSYNKAYRSKDHALYNVFDDLFNTVIREIIAVGTTHLKSKTIGVLLVAVYKDGNEMTYPLAFGKRGDVINLYYRATYVNSVEEFDRLMAKMKSIYSKFHDELVEVGIQKFSLVHCPRKRYHMTTTNILESMNSCVHAI